MSVRAGLSYGCMVAGVLLVLTSWLETGSGAVRASAAPRDSSALEDASGSFLSLGEHDFGGLIGFVQKNHVFRVRNDGPSTWEVRRHWQDCGCVRVLSTSRTAAPGEELTVEIAIDTEGLSMSRVEKHVFVDVGANTPLLRGTLRANVVHSPHLRPTRVLVELSPDKDVFVATTELFVPAAGDAPIHIQLEPAESSPEVFGLDVLALERREGYLVYPLLLSGALPLENEEASLVAAISLEQGDERERLFATIELARRPWAQVSPRRLLLLPEAERAAELILSGARPEHLRDLVVEVDPPGAADVVRASDSPRMQIELRGTSRGLRSVRVFPRGAPEDALVIPVHFQKP